MLIDPTSDPWGAALAGAGILAVLTLLIAIGARLGGRRAGLSGWLLGLSLTGFLGSAVGGTLARVSSAHAEDVERPPGDPAALPDQDADPEPPAGEAEADVPAAPIEDVGAPGTTPDVGSGGLEAAAGEDATTEDAIVEDPIVDGDDATADGDDASDSAVEDTASDIPAADATPGSAAPEASKLDPLDPLPADPTELKTATRLILREGKRVASSLRDCKEPGPVGNAWAALVQLPPDVYRDRVEVIARRLEACRRKVTWGRTYAIHRQRVDARDDFRETIRKRLADKDIRVSTAVSGIEHERLRVGGKGLGKQSVAALLDDGLSGELAAIGFEKVTFANGTDTWTTKIEAVTDKQRVTEDLALYGLAEPLALPKAP